MEILTLPLHLLAASLQPCAALGGLIQPPANFTAALAHSPPPLTASLPPSSTHHTLSLPNSLTFYLCTSLLLTPAHSLPMMLARLLASSLPGQLIKSTRMHSNPLIMLAPATLGATPACALACNN